MDGCVMWYCSVCVYCGYMERGVWRGVCNIVLQAVHSVDLWSVMCGGVCVM